MTPRHLPTLSPTPVTPTVMAPDLPADLSSAAVELQWSSVSSATRRAYVSDWRRWVTWCEQHHVTALPAHPATVCAYLADHAGQLTVATLRRHLATVSKAHQLAGVETPCSHPTVRDTVRGIQRTWGVAQDEAPGLLPPDMAAVLDEIEQGVAADRDRALLLVGWCGALRRSELAHLQWGDVAHVAGGVHLTLRYSKTDQVGAGRLVPLARDERNPYRCPVHQLDQWRTTLARCSPTAVLDTAPVFPRLDRWGHVGGVMSGQAVALVIQRRCQQAGLPTKYRGHSLRKGAVMATYQAGVSDSRVMATTGHKSVTMLRRYQGQVGLIEQCATRGLL